MEKAQLLEAGGTLPSSISTKSSRRTLPLYFIALLCTAALLHLSPLYARISQHESVDSTGKLIPTKCWDDTIKPPFACYYMKAPLDYLNSTDKRTARLAVVTYPAGGGKTHKKDILGTLLVNPGGPGGSGVGFLTRIGPRTNYTSTAAAFDVVMKGRYNFLSWDPRAIGYSSPTANCYTWPSQEASSLEEGLPRASSAALGYNLQSHRLNSKLCSAHPTLSDELRFVSTSSTARDMRLLHKAAGDEHLHYWGFSYGTVLGSVYSDMFPEDVGRVVLDGTVDVPNYMAGNWSDNLLDTQNTYEKGLLGKCAAAGDRCAMNSAVKNGRDLKSALDELYSSLITMPMISTETNTTFLDYTSFKMAIFGAIYSPFGWPAITVTMADVLQGNATAFIKSFIDSPSEPSSSPHAMVAIAGGDTLIRREHTWGLEDYKMLIAELEEQSDFAGEIWASDKSSVQSWSIVGSERHFGNYSSFTRHPILYVGNDYDPVTPLLYARKMATLFPNASVLRVKSFGHCSISQPSKCAAQTIADYFINGTVPERTMATDGYVKPGKICSVDRDPWDDVAKQDEDGNLDLESEAIMSALLRSWK